MPSNLLSNIAHDTVETPLRLTYFHKPHYSRLLDTFTGRGHTRTLAQLRVSLLLVFVLTCCMYKEIVFNLLAVGNDG